MSCGTPADTPGRTVDDGAGPLRAQQRAMAALVTGDDDAACADDGLAARTLLRAPREGTPPRLAVYRVAYRGRLVEALRSNVPVLARVLGDDDFAELALAYLAGHPSRQPSIRWFGHALADWMQARREAGDPVVAHESLEDLARMEWALGTSFDSEDAVPVAAADLAALPAGDWPALRFAAHPSLRLVPMRFAVEPLWKALTADEDAQVDAPEAAGHVLAIWREGLATRWRSLPGEEHAALAACTGGEAFAALCERVAGWRAAAGQDPDGAAPQVAGWLRGWIDAGMLRRAG